MLLSYGTDLEHLYRQAADHVDKILKGTPAAILPIARPEKIEFIINLETAKELGIQVPTSMLARADRVIE
jgi:putative ABC transport system substrate-binding protein